MSQESAPHGIACRDNHALKYEVSGHDHGIPVLLMHGTPGSRKGPKPRSSVLYRMGIRLITFDRPGYGGSDRRKGRSVADGANDVLAIADHLGLDRFAIVGRSGGGPYALACAASDMLASRITRVAVLVTIAPPNAAGLDWYRGMGSTNLEEHSIDPVALTAALTDRADRTRTDPQTLLDHLGPDLTPDDRWIVGSGGMGEQIKASYAEAVRPGAFGWIDDDLAFRRAWGFDPASIKLPVRLWHGARDAFSPPAHTEWLATQIDGVEKHVQDDAGHFGAVEILPTILSWLAAPEAVGSR